MKELQKILKEIDELITEYMDGDVPLGMQDFCAGMKKSQEIICNHMNDGWIPVEERLPEEGEECLAQFEVKVRNTRNEVIKATYIHVLYLEGGIWKSFAGIPNGKVIAWRPLPEPYRPERSEEE